MKILDAVARILKEEGIQWVGCFPSNNLIEAVAQAGINPIMFRQERGAAMAVDGFSRMKNREEFGVLITQGGPGSEILWEVLPKPMRIMFRFYICREDRLWLQGQ